MLISSLSFGFIFSFPFIFLFGVKYWILIFISLFIIKIIWFSVWKKNFYFEFTANYILLRTGVVSRQENHLSYKSIQNILNNQGFFEKILDISTVTIQNAAVQMVDVGRGQSVPVSSGISLVWQPKAKAEELNKILNDVVSKINPQNQNNNMGL